MLFHYIFPPFRYQNSDEEWRDVRWCNKEFTANDSIKNESSENNRIFNLFFVLNDFAVQREKNSEKLSSRQADAKLEISLPSFKTKAW